MALEGDTATVARCRTPPFTRSQGLALMSDSEDDSESAAEQKLEPRPIPPKPTILAGTPLKNGFSSVNAEREKAGLTPLQNLVAGMRERLEERAAASGTPVKHQSGDKVSPNLARLRSTPSGRLRERQRQLAQKHHSAKNRLDQLVVGGGVSLWPEMDNMRLTRRETVTLIATSLSLILLTLTLFSLIHGEVQSRLIYYMRQLHSFSHHHPIIKYTTNASFKFSVLAWHTAYTELMSELEGSFRVSLPESSALYQLCVVLYVTGIGMLLYYLADSILAKSNLSPRRIKIWVCLLVAMATWTLLFLQLLVLAISIEHSVESNVHNLNEHMSDLVYLDLDLTTYRDVLSYWRTRCLPPTSLGTLVIMGVVSVRDVVYYLQYYSLPVATAILSPVVQLIWSLQQIYSFPVVTPVHQKSS